MQDKSIKANAVFNIIYKLSSLVFPLLVYPYVSRVLMADNLGKVSFFSNMTNYAITVASLGISTYGVRAISKARSDAKACGKVARDLILLNAIVSTLVVAALCLSLLFVDKFRSESFLFAINCCQIALVSLNVEWIFNGIEEYGFIAIRAIIVRALTLVCIFLFVKKSSDYKIYALITILGFISNYIVNFVYSLRFITYTGHGKPSFLIHLKPMLLLFASVLAINVYTHVDSVMLGFINDDRAVGLYDIACKAKLVLLSLINAISGVLFPRLSYYLAAGDEGKYNAILKKSVSVIFMIAIPMTVGFFIEAKDVVLVLGGSDFVDATLCMQILMPILIISGFSNITGNQILLPHGMDSSYMAAVSIGAAVDVALNAILMPKYSLYGAAAATLVAEVVQMSIQTYRARKYLRGNIDLAEIAKTVLCTAIAAAVTIVISTIQGLNPLVRVGLYFVGFGLVYLVMLILFKSKSLKTILSKDSDIQ